MGEHDDGAGGLLLKRDYFEGCPGCMFDRQKQMQRGLPIKQVLTIWIIVLSPALTISSLFPFLYFMSSCDANVDEPRVDQVARKAWDPLALPEGPITRGRLKRFKEALNGLMLNYQEVPSTVALGVEGFEVHGNQVGDFCNIIEVLVDQESSILAHGTESSTHMRDHFSHTCACSIEQKLRRQNYARSYARICAP